MKLFLAFLKKKTNYDYFKYLQNKFVNFFNLKISFLDNNTYFYNISGVYYINIIASVK